MRKFCEIIKGNAQEIINFEKIVPLIIQELES